MAKSIAILLLITLCYITAKECDRPGYWGPDCNSVCGMCEKKGDTETPCAKDTGKCPGSCAEGWQSNDKSGKCDIAQCWGAPDGCAVGGKCVAPNYCICGEQGAQVVGKELTKDGVKGIDCVSLRWDGIKGAAIAMVVMFVSIGICGGIERVRSRGKSRAKVE